MMIKFSLAFLLLCVAQISTAADNAPVHGGNGVVLPPPPSTQAEPVTETLHGVTVTDPYRWLEDSKSPATRAWLAAQMKYTENYLAQVKVRPEIAKRLTELVRVESFSIPIERENKFFFKKRLPEENQGSLFMREGLKGNDVKLVDAGKLSADQNTSLNIVDVSKDGGLLVYEVREGGADEQVIRLLDIKSRRELPDTLPAARYGGVNLSPDEKGLYYSKFEPIGSLVFYHRLGTAVSSDSLIFGKEFGGEKFGPMDLIYPEVTENGRYLLIHVAQGVPAKRLDIYAKDLRQPDAPIRPIIHGIDSRFQPVNYGDDLYVQTDYKAENYRVIKVSLADPAPEKWTTIVPEATDVVSTIGIVGGKLFVTGLHDVITQTQVYTLDGKLVRKIAYPTLGAASGMFGQETSNHAFYNFESFTIPPAIY
ncbi:MAG TPA: S9 family peptidase, partial [Candidatus Angelobacter sp.]|nr:S9 family peptidase [Candidatus Angelobacter sp.]